MARKKVAPAVDDGEVKVPKTTKPTIRKGEKGKRLRKRLADSRFPFLKLPGEIRNRIYEFALVDPIFTISINRHVHKPYARRRDLSVPRELMKTGDWSAWLGRQSDEDKKQLKAKTRFRKWEVNAQLCPQLLRLCKQIKKEATWFLYAKNHFMFLDLTAMNQFLGQCEDRVPWIRTITLAFMEKEDKSQQMEAFQKLGKAADLEALILGKGFLKSFAYGFTDDCGTRAANGFYHLATNWLWNSALSLGSKEAIFDRLLLAPNHTKQKPQYFTRFPARFGAGVELADAALFEQQFRKRLLQCME